MTVFCLVELDDDTVAEASLRALTLARGLASGSGLAAVVFGAPPVADLAASRTYRGILETFTLPLPCVVTVKEGINLPRYPSLPGRLRAKRASITRVAVRDAGPAAGNDIRLARLRVPEAPRKQATVLGHGPDAVPALVSVLAEIGVLS